MGHKNTLTWHMYGPIEHPYLAPVWANRIPFKGNTWHLYGHKNTPTWHLTVYGWSPHQAAEGTMARWHLMPHQPPRLHTYPPYLPNKSYTHTSLPPNLCFLKLVLVLSYTYLTFDNCNNCIPSNKVGLFFVHIYKDFIKTFLFLVWHISITDAGRVAHWD